MNLYYLILVWLLAVYMVNSTVNFRKAEVVCRERVWRYRFFWAFLIFLPLIIWSGYRGYVGDSLLSSKLQKN